MKQFILISFSLLAMCSACRPYHQDDYKEQYVVESYLYTGRSLPLVHITKTIPVQQPYSYRRLSSVKNANVHIQLLDNENRAKVEQTFEYTFQKDNYYPVQEHTVLPGRTYRLLINIPGYSQTVTAQTQVPEVFEILRFGPDTLQYQSGEPLSLTISASHYPGRQNVYMVGIHSQVPEVENLTPHYAALYEEKEYDPHYFNFLQTHDWGVLTAGNFTPVNEEALSIVVPWNEIPFFNKNNILVSALDDNLFDFIRSQSIQRSYQGLPPGEIQNVLTYVEGALGIFGAVTSDTVRVFVKPQQN